MLFHALGSEIMCSLQEVLLQGQAELCLVSAMLSTSWARTEWLSRHSQLLEILPEAPATPI